jgi:GAF domain-containing protein
VYNRLEVQPAPQIWEPEIGQAIERHSTVESHTDQRSLIVTPLAVRGEIIGALGLYDKPDQPLTPEDVALVEAASEQVALALESARLFDQIQRDAEREHTLNRIATAINRSSSINELLPTALEIALEVIGFDCGLATLFDTETNTLRVVVQRDLPEEVVSHLKNGLGGTLCEYVFLQGQATLLEDMRQSAPLDVTGLVAQGLLSYVGIPLIYQDHTLGTLCMFSTTPKLLSEKMDTLLQSIGQQLGVGVTNARLLEQTQRDAERERTINRITSQIRNASSVDEVLEIAAQELSVLTHASRSVIEIAPGGSGQAGNGQTARHA